jgi:acetyl esterase/lipase
VAARPGLPLTGTVDRRGALTLMALGAIAAACSGRDRGTTDEADVGTSPTPAAQDDGQDTSVEIIRYGDDPSQRAELTRPDGTSRGVVVVIHGGFWLDQYDLSLGRPLAVSLAAEGWTAYNVEYRRVGNGGGWPQTFDDVAAAIDALADVEGVDTAKVVTLGHSAGGHLAVWAAGRPRLADARWSSPVVPVTAAVSQAGVLDLAAATDDDLGSGAVQRFMGGAVDERYADADPTAVVPLAVPVRCVHGTDDTNVPLSQSVDYVERATAAGADATLTEVDGDHFVVIDTSSRAWELTLGILATL